MSAGTHKPSEAMHKIEEPKPNALSLLQEYRKTMPSDLLHIWASDACDTLFQQHERIVELEDDLQFVERWAVHHGSKPSISAQEALSCIQHYPAIYEITKSYKDGKRPDTFNPYARIAELESQLESIGAGGVESLRGNTAGGVRCHDADACAMGQLPCPTPAACNQIAPAAQGMEQDAARYRWLRRNIGVYRTNDGAGPVSAYLLMHTTAKDLIAEETDAAIDAAIAAQAKQGEQA